jgi:hypothetical protein
MTEAEKYFLELGKEIPGVKEGKMFGSLCLKTSNGKSGAMLWKDHIVVKLQGKDFEESLKLKGAKQFEPMEGRPMKEWIQIPYVHKTQWKKLALLSIEAAKKAKKK